MDSGSTEFLRITGVLGVVEFLKGVDKGEIKLEDDPWLGKYNRPPDPAAQPVSTETRTCSYRLPDGHECGGVMRAHPANPDNFHLRIVRFLRAD